MKMNTMESYRIQGVVWGIKLFGLSLLQVYQRDNLNIAPCIPVEKCCNRAAVIADDVTAKCQSQHYDGHADLSCTYHDLFLKNYSTMLKTLFRKNP